MGKIFAIYAITAHLWCQCKLLIKQLMLIAVDLMLILIGYYNFGFYFMPFQAIEPFLCTKDIKEPQRFQVWIFSGLILSIFLLMMVVLVEAYFPYSSLCAPFLKYESIFEVNSFCTFYNQFSLQPVFSKSFFSSVCWIVSKIIAVELSTFWTVLFISFSCSFYSNMFFFFSILFI